MKTDRLLSWLAIILAGLVALKIWGKIPVPWWGIFIPGYPVAAGVLLEIMMFIFRDRKKENDHERGENDG